MGVSRVRTILPVVALLCCAVTPLVAEPYLAIRTGLKCSQCHVNRTGGGARNAFGSAWAQTELPMRTVGVRSRSLTDWVAIGFDLRAVASLVAREPDNAPPPRTAVEINEAQVQVEARVISNILAFYLDETVGPDRAVAREAFALVEWRPLNGYAKAGKFLLPYGLRLWDDAAFIRSQTGFTYQTPDIGFEVGIEPGPLSLALAVSNGNQGSVENDADKMVTASAALVYPRVRVGASGSRNSAPGSRTEIVGGFGGFTLGQRLVVLGEADWILSTFAGQPDRDQFVAYVEGDLLLSKGWNAKVTYGYHDPNLDLAEDQRVRMRFGLEAFPVSFVQLSAFYNFNDNAGAPDDLDVVSLEVHLHF